MNITIIAVGKLKEKYLTQNVLEYNKRLGRYCELKIIEVKDERVPENYSDGQKANALDKEGKAIIKHLNDKGIVIAMDVKGEQLTSPEFARKLEDYAIFGNSHLFFIIGGSLGLSKEVYAQADYRLSFSKMTFPHQLFRIFLLEQIYRAFKIIKGETYHK